MKGHFFRHLKCVIRDKNVEWGVGLLSGAVFFLIIFFSVPSASHATNGMNLIGYGPIAAAIGGADVAVLGGCSPIATNPANLVQVCDKSFAVGFTLLAPRIHLKTGQTGIAPNNSVSSVKRVFAFPFLAAAKTVDEHWGIGLGVFGQGGMGVDFKDVGTAFGTRDELQSLVRFLRLTPAVVYKATDSLSLGIGVHLGYSDVGYKFFPSTSFSGQNVRFFGQELRRAKTNAIAFSFGIHWKIRPDLSLGVDYVTESRLDFEDGNFFVNFDSIGSGIVKYRGSVDNFAWPEQARFGLGIRINKNLFVTGEVRYIWWSHAVDRITVSGKKPSRDVPEEFQTFKVEFPFEWHNQWVFAIGADIRLTPEILLRLGYNHGDNPVPASNLAPLFPAIVSDHITAGLRFKCPCIEGWSVDLAYEHAFKKKAALRQESDNPFGKGLELTSEQDVISVFLTTDF